MNVYEVIFVIMLYRIIETILPILWKEFREWWEETDALIR